MKGQTVATADELKQAIEKFRDGLEKKSGKLVEFGEGGPVNLTLIDSIYQVLTKLEARIDALEKQ
jgi:hypothetical protein